MSFFTDLFEGNFGNLGTDLSHTFSSLGSHPDELAETLGVGGLIAAPFVLPEIGAAFGIGDAAAAGTGDVAVGSLGSDLGIGDIGAAAAADTAAGGGTLASSLGIGDIGSAAAADSASALADSSVALGGGFSDFPGVSSFGSGDSIGAGAGSGSAFNIDTATSGVNVDQFGNPINTGTTPSLTGGTGTGAAPTGGGAGAADAASSTLEPGAFAGTGKGAGDATAGASGGLSGILSSPYTKLALGAAPLALALARGETTLPPQAAALQAQALQMQQLGLTNLNQAQAGILNAGQTAQLAQMRADLTNQWLQTLYNQGVTDPTKDARWPQIKAVIDGQVTQQTAQLIQQNVTNALAETGQAASALTSIAQMQMQADQNFTNALINATKSLGMVAGLNAGTTLKLAA